MRTSKRIEEVSSKGTFTFFPVLVISVFSFGHFLVIVQLFVHAAAQKKQELAERVKDLSKDFEVGFYVM